MIVGTLEKEKNYCWVQGNTRGKLYSFLSAVFKDEMSLEQIEEFCTTENMTRLKDSFAVLPEDKASPLLKSMADLTTVWESRLEKNEPEAETLELRKEYAYLFLTPNGVYPFESVYRGKKNLLMDKPWEEVRGFYRRVGLEKDKNEKHPEDHAAVELGFMASLAFLSGNELPDLPSTVIEKDEISYALQVQQAFLTQHLMKWIPRLCDDIQEKTRHPFYRSVAELAGLFVEADGQMLQALTPESN